MWEESYSITTHTHATAFASIVQRCLETPAEAVMMSRPNSDSHLSSRGSAPFLDEPASPQDSIPCHPRVVRRRSDRRRSLRGTGNGSSRPEERLIPEERAMIERLMLRVKECGEESAVELAFGVGDGDGTATSDPVGETRAVNFDLAHRPLNSPSDLMDAVESGIVPVDPTTGYPSVKHLDSISARHRFGFLPFNNEALRLARSDGKPQHNGLRSTDEFDKTPQFMDALLCLADSLFHVPPKERRAELRRQLRVLECELLPSNSVYVPIGNVHHRVWRIVVDESVCIGTKERVPCIVCVEVVDYPFKKRRPRAWSFLDRLPKRVQASSSREATETETPSSISPTRRVSNEGIELPDIRSEAETISEWRYSRRDPRRRSSIFDVVSSTVRESMKGPLDKMKTQMRNAYPDRPTDEELKSLTITEENHAHEHHPSNDALLGKSITFDEADSSTEVTASESPQESIIAIKDSKEPSNLSRVNSAASIASMGQWTSPTPAGRTLVQPKHGLDLDESVGVSLPYGSDQEEELSRRKGGVQKVNSSTRPPVVFRESWQSKQDRLRSKSAYGHHPGWKIVPLLIKANDDLRQEQLASQLIYRMAAILSREKVPVWLCPYEIIALTESGGVVEAIPDTISLDSLKRNDPNYHGLKFFFLSHFGEGTEEYADAQANFVESLAAYSIVCFLLQLKDRHNGNILLDNRGHIIHIDFGFFFLSSPGKNAGFESAPFKLTRDFVEMLGGPNGRMFRAFRELCVKTFITLRKHCMEIILLVEMLKTGNEELNCFRGRPDEAIRQLRDRFRLDLNDRACREYVNCLVDDSIENVRPSVRWFLFVPRQSSH
jgi:phosphatidylinositol 4-kinase B